MSSQQATTPAQHTVSGRMLEHCFQCLAQHRGPGLSVGELYGLPPQVPFGTTGRTPRATFSHVLNQYTLQDGAQIERTKIRGRWHYRLKRSPPERQVHHTLVPGGVQDADDTESTHPNSVCEVDTAYPVQVSVPTVERTSGRALKVCVYLCA